jgi:glucosamine--fructose-6-phosphate aminotransferase (isomerizing)
MCGIVGYIGYRDAVTPLTDGLERLEYRGYDSVGIAVVDAGILCLAKCQGRVRELKERLSSGFKGSPGIAHTRWATHGDPSDRNAHPHCDSLNRFAIVHNGIIENAKTLRSELEADGVVFRSDTDSEVLAHLIATMASGSLELAVRKALRRVVGTYALAVLDALQPDYLIIARHGSPVMLGIGDHEMFFASDAAAFVRHTQKVIHLDDGEIAVLRTESFETSTLAGRATLRPPIITSISSQSPDKGRYDHYMRKEIAEQPEALRRTLSSRIDSISHSSLLDEAELDARELLITRRITIVGCGSAYISGCLGAHLIEQLARIPVHVEPASEFCYRNPVIDEDTLYIAVSQSGETFDTIQAINYAKRNGGRVLGVVNVAGSTIARECGRALYVHAGPEIAVVSTKTFTCTVVTFALLALAIGRMRDLLGTRAGQLLEALSGLPKKIESIIARENEIVQMAKRFESAEHAYFLGRASGYAVAMEGALKVKEVSYLHAEAYPAAELKHGPLALISPQVPSILVMPRDGVFSKNVSTVEEIRARRGPVLVVTNHVDVPMTVDEAFVAPASEPALDPVLMNIPLQLLAYHVALNRGCDIDRPRNLAKCVTVE